MGSGRIPGASGRIPNASDRTPNASGRTGGLQIITENAYEDAAAHEGAACEGAAAREGAAVSAPDPPAKNEVMYNFMPMSACWADDIPN